MLKPGINKSRVTRMHLVARFWNFTTESIRFKFYPILYSSSQGEEECRLIKQYSDRYG